MKNRRLTSMLILTVASVFLFFCMSCGIPTYIVPTISFSSITAGNNTDSFNVSYTCDDQLGDSGRVGLVLLYLVDGTTPVSNSTLISNFKSKFVPTEYNGVDITVTEEEPVLSASDISLYAFRRNDSLIADPEYTLELPNDGNFSRLIQLDYVDGNIEMSVEGMQVAVLTLDQATSAGVGQYIGIYAAVSVKSISYTNHFWSDLKFVGSIRIVEEE